MSNCIVCGARLPDVPLMAYDNMPASAQDIPTKEELDADKGITLRFYQCSGCGLIQADCEPVSYYRDVIRAGGYSSTMKELRRDEYRRFIDRCGLEGKKIIEVGCGRGEFLKTLREFPVQVYGVEHKRELVQLARAEGLNVAEGFTETADTVFPGGPFDAFLSFNFLEHQPDPNTMLKCIYNNLTENGCGLITVPDFRYIQENDSFYELLRDHLSNFTDESLEFLVKKNGFSILERRRVNRDTIEFIVQKRPAVDVSGLVGNLSKLSAQLREYTESRLAEGKRIAVWGASHQGFTTVAATGVSDRFSYIIDSAPFKQGKFSPASHLPIVSPQYFHEDPVDCILIIAPGYTEEISKTIRSEYGPGVEIAAIRTATIEVLGG